MRDPGATEFGPERSAPNLVTQPMPVRPAQPSARARSGPQRPRANIAARPLRPPGWQASGSSQPWPSTPDAGRPARRHWPYMTERDRCVDHADFLPESARRPGRSPAFRARASFGQAGHALAPALAGQERRSRRRGLGPAARSLGARRRGRGSRAARSSHRWEHLYGRPDRQRLSTRFRAAFSQRRGYLAWQSESVESERPARWPCCPRGAPAFARRRRSTRSTGTPARRAAWGWCWCRCRA